MKYFLIILLIIPSYLFSQSYLTVTGTVVDQNTHAPLQGASVFAQSTTVGEATKQDGSFTLKLPYGGYDLIVTYTGYETSVTRINSSSTSTNLVIEMKPKEKSLEEVSIVFSNEVKDGWQKYGSFFNDNFVGKSSFAGQTSIKNPEVLKFFYSKKRNRLKVTAEQPLILVNKALGYNIKYTLDSFAYEYNTNASTFAGYPLFEEMKGTVDEAAAWEKNRSVAYNGSILHFMRSLYEKTLSENGFEVQFLVSTNGTERSIPLKNPYLAVNYDKDDSTNTVDFMPNQPSMAIIYKAPPETAYFLTDANAKKDFQLSMLNITPGESITIERNGYYFDQSDMIINGYWSYEKVGNMLPYDYKQSP